MLKVTGAWKSRVGGPLTLACSLCSTYVRCWGSLVPRENGEVRKTLWAEELLYCLHFPPVTSVEVAALPPITTVLPCLSSRLPTCCRTVVVFTLS